MKTPDFSTRIPVSDEPEVNQCAIRDIAAEWRGQGMTHGRVTAIPYPDPTTYILEGWREMPNPEPPVPTA